MTLKDTASLSPARIAARISTRITTGIATRITRGIATGAAGVLLLLGSGLLAGCADDDIVPDPPGVSRQAVPPDFQVQATIRHHPVAMSAAAQDVSPAERASLARFLDDLSGGRFDALHVRVAGNLSDDGQKALLRVLVAQGIEPSKIEFREAPPDRRSGSGAPPPVPLAARPLAQGSATRPRVPHPFAVNPPTGYPDHAVERVDVIAEVYRPLPPLCPRTSRLGILGNDNGMASNFGCATVSNFEQMVADPRDLVRGEGGGTTDSEVTSGAIDRMRKDKTKTLIDNGGSVTTGGGG